MSVEFDKLLANAAANPGQASYTELFDYVRAHKVGEAEILRALEKAVNQSEWVVVGLLVACIVQFHLVVEGARSWKIAPEFAPLLTRILDEAATTVNNDDVVDLLHTMKDERTIPSLIRAIGKSFPCDSYSRCISRKALQALALFNRADAWDAIRTAAGSEIELIREEAQMLVERRELG